jgi:hypothetical protein
LKWYVLNLILYVPATIVYALMLFEFILAKMVQALTCT